MFLHPQAGPQLQNMNFDAFISNRKKTHHASALTFADLLSNKFQVDNDLSASWSSVKHIQQNLLSPGPTKEQQGNKESDLGLTASDNPLYHIVKHWLHVNDGGWVSFTLVCDCTRSLMSYTSPLSQFSRQSYCDQVICNSVELVNGKQDAFIIFPMLGR
jgi:hypothetical protein